MFEIFKKNRAFQLVFSLICGIAYFIIAYSFIGQATKAGGGFLAFLFCPAIICGMALVIIKSIRRFIEEENKKAVNFLFIVHIIIITASVLTAIMMILY